MIFDLKDELDKKKAITRFNALLEKESKIDLKKVIKLRTPDQNAYIHALFSIFGIEFGYTLEESKTHIKRKCPFMRYEKDGEIFLKKTSKLSSLEMYDLVDWFRNYSSQKGLYLLSADEYKAKRSQIDQEIAKYKQYM